MDAYLGAFRLPKEGSTTEEYEDAFFPRKDRIYPIGKSRRFAIADGATETSFSGVWARLLVCGFVRRTLAIPFTLEQLTPLQARWRRLVGAKPLPWYAEEKLTYGAFAALLGLELSETHGPEGSVRSWLAIATGDCCLVQVRKNGIVATFPFADSSSFNSRPDLLASLPAFNSPEMDQVKTYGGSWGCDDTFFLMTDALACWFFKEREAGNEPWNSLRDLGTQGHVSFQELVSSLRHSTAMKNDDVTLVQIDIR